MSRTHALLSPSGAHRWMVCTPSARLTEGLNTQSSYADEGTLAHDLGELLVKDKLGLIKPGAFASKLTEIQRNQYYCKAMFEHCSDYADLVCEKYNAYKAQGLNPAILIEAEIDYSYYVPGGKGYVDIIIYTEKHICVIDLKYGAGVPVKAYNNAQLKLYALGGLNTIYSIPGNLFTHGIKEVYLCIFQPRNGGKSDWMLTANELEDWAEKQLKPAALLAWNGEGDFIAGDHCKFCAVKSSCRALATANLEIAKKAFSDPVLLEDEEISDLLDQFDLMKSWIKSVEEMALTAAVQGKKWPRYKLVAGISRRTYKDEKAIRQRLLERQFLETQFTTNEVFTIGKMEEFLGPKEFKNILSDLVIKPKGKPTLVDQDDPRPDYKTIDEAKKAFTDEPIEDFG
jgi:hypothetical protein